MPPQCIDKCLKESRGFFLFVCLLAFLFLFFFEIGFLCGFGACPGTHSVDQAGLKLTEICVPLPTECWD